MALSAGTRLGPYEILEPLGAGGMGEVYRATDTKLGRKVAIKTLPSEVTGDSERLARFQREAHLLASLNHPNIAAIHGLEEADGKPFLVLELVEGEDLAERLKRGAIPVDEALEIAKQIAEGLEAAHEKGIVHRDLKPANVKLTPDGKVKVLDFGLAKAWAGDAAEGSSSSASMSESPTLAHSGTQAGVILGTAAYMSPEQARGKAVDKRGDVWAFGVLLWEMLTGRTLFAGDTVTDIIAAVMKEELDLEALPTGTPPAVRRLIARCLRKDPRTRLPDVGAARLELQEIVAGTVDAEITDAPRPRHRTVVAAVVVGMALYVAGWLLKPTPEPQPQLVRKLDLAVPGLRAGFDTPPTISPDGTRVVYSSGGRLWVRRLDRLEPVALAGTEGAAFFFWSPDGTRIGYVGADSRLWTIAAGGGEPSALAALPTDIPGSGGGAWGLNGRIVISGSNSVGLLEVPEQGGDARTLLELDRENEVDFHEISALPDDRGLLFTVHGVSGSDTIALFAQGSRKTVLRLEGQSLRSPVYSHSGHILYTRETTNPGIWALPFALAELEATGEPFLVAARGSVPSVSSDGTFAYVREGLTRETLEWVDRSGQAEPLAEMQQSSFVELGRLSPDASRVLLDFMKDGNWDLWSYDLSRGAMARLTFHAREDHAGVWSADGERIVFTSQRGGPAYNLYSRPADGSGTPERLTEGEAYDTPETISPDGRWLLFSRWGRGQTDELWKLSLDGGGAPEPLIQSQYSVWDAALSPDGRWLAYRSDESGRSEIYVQAFPELGGKQQISTEGGVLPRWSRTGGELFFGSGDHMMVVALSADDEVLRATRPRELFALDRDLERGGYDVAPDGRFVMIRGGEGTTITIVLNWFEELKSRMREAEE